MKPGTPHSSFYRTLRHLFGFCDVEVSVAKANGNQHFPFLTVALALKPSEIGPSFKAATFTGWRAVHQGRLSSQ